MLGLVFLHFVVNLDTSRLVSVLLGHSICVVHHTAVLCPYELPKEMHQCQERGTEVNERTAELYCEQCNTHITELMIID